MLRSSSKLLQSSEELFRKIKPEKLKRGKEESIKRGKHIHLIGNIISQPAFTCLLGVFIVNFEHISHLVLVFLLLTLSR